MTNAEDAERLVAEWKGCERKIEEIMVHIGEIKAELGAKLGLTSAVSPSQYGGAAPAVGAAVPPLPPPAVKLAMRTDGAVAEGTKSRRIIEAMLKIGGEGTRAEIASATPNDGSPPKKHTANVGALLLYLKQCGYIQPRSMHEMGGWCLTDRAREALKVGVQTPLLR